MKQETDDSGDSDMLDDYDFSGGVRGKYVRRFAKGTNLVALAPDIIEIFPDSESVNDALCAIAHIARKQTEKLSS